MRMFTPVKDKVDWPFSLKSNLFQHLKSKKKQRIKGHFISISTEPVAFCQVDSFQNVIAYFPVELHIPLVHSQCSSSINTRKPAKHSTTESRNQLTECWTKQPLHTVMSLVSIRLKDVHYSNYSSCVKFLAIVASMQFFSDLILSCGLQILIFL